MDNAKNCRAAGRLISLRYPHIFSNGCATHSMNLILKDWYTHESTTWFARIIDSCHKVVKFVLRLQRVLDIYRPRMSCMLKLPAETRFCTHFYTLESLLRNKVAIVETFTCMAFHDWEDDESDSSKEKINIHSDLGKERWWKDVASAYHVMMPVMYAIHYMDQSVANMGKVWMTWRTMQQSLQNPKEIKDSVIKPWQIPFSAKQCKVFLILFDQR